MRNILIFQSPTVIIQIGFYMEVHRYVATRTAVGR